MSIITQDGYVFGYEQHYKGISAAAAQASFSMEENFGKDFSLQVSLNAGTATSWEVKLQVSNDGVNWFDLITHSNTGDSLGDVKAVVDFPAKYARVDVTDVTGTGGFAVDIDVVVKP